MTCPSVKCLSSFLVNTASVGRVILALLWRTALAPVAQGTAWVKALHVMVTCVLA